MGCLLDLLTQGSCTSLKQRTLQVVWHKMSALYVMQLLSLDVQVRTYEINICHVLLSILS